ncbi:unnamed protein product [Camellia sinensis]
MEFWGQKFKTAPNHHVVVMDSFPMTNTTCDNRRDVNSTRMLGVRAENVLNLVKKRHSEGENSKQPPKHCMTVTDSFPMTNTTCDNRQDVNNARRLGVRAENALNLVEKWCSRGKNSTATPNHCVAVTDSFPMTNTTCDKRQNVNSTCRLVVRAENALNLVEKWRSGGKNSKQPPNHRVAVTDSFPMTNTT